MRRRITPGAQILLGLFLGGTFVWFMEAALFELRWGWHGRILDVRGDRVTLRIGDGETRLFAVLDGDIALDEATGEVELRAPGAHVSIEERTRSGETWFLATWTGDDPVVEWRRDGELFEPGPSDRAWLGDRLLEVERSTGRKADERVAALLAAGGEPEVLAELERLRGGDVIAAYAEALLERGRLDAEQSATLLDVLGDRVGSDERLAALLRKIPLDSDETWVSFSRAARSIGSDGILADLLATRLPTGEEPLDEWLGAAETVGSDAELSGALRALLATLPPGRDLPGAFDRVVASIGSDGEHRRVLEAALVERRPTPADLDELLLEARSIGSDQELSGLLAAIAETLDLPRLGPGFWEAAATVGTDADLAGVLVLVAARPGLDPEDLQQLVQTSTTLGTDRHQADVLIAALEAGADPALVRAVGLGTVGSEREAARVLATLREVGPVPVDPSDDRPPEDGAATVAPADGADPGPLEAPPDSDPVSEPAAGSRADGASAEDPGTSPD